MKKQQKRINKLPIVFLLLIVLYVNGTDIANAQYSEVPTAGIAINGKMVDGINPIRIKGDYFLPLTRLSKILGYNHIIFEKQTLTYEMTDGSENVRTTMGGTLAKRGDEYIHIEPPRWINKTAYVSLNAGGALFNVTIDFRAENGSIQVQKPALSYIVQKDDTLWEIARAHHTTVNAIKNVNHLNTNLIITGQRLILPPKEKTKEKAPIHENEPIGRTGDVRPLYVQRQNILNQATEYIGAKYKFGATLDEAPHLFDCSSFTQLVFKQNGIDIPRVSRDQARKGKYVTQLKPGDLMFFTDSELYSDGRVGHVGIYMGDGSMIHASTSLGVDITENVLGNSYWGENYLYSKRVIE